MAIQEKDVLDTLFGDPVRKINFWLQGLHICPFGYVQVAYAIQQGKIKIKEGPDKDWASYCPVKQNDGTPANTLLTQKVTAIDDLERALLLHECTHAYVDLSMATKTTTLSDEAAAYIAQGIYLEVTGAADFVRDGSRFGRMFHHVGEIIHKFKLHKPEGRGRRLELKDYAHLRELIHHVKQYKKVGWNELSGANGV